MLMSVIFLLLLIRFYLPITTYLFESLFSYFSFISLFCYLSFILSYFNYHRFFLFFSINFCINIISFFLHIFTLFILLSFLLFSFFVSIIILMSLSFKYSTILYPFVFILSFCLLLSPSPHPRLFVCLSLKVSAIPINHDYKKKKFPGHKKQDQYQ